MQLYTREYGRAGPGVVLLHGGPGAAGYMGEIAERLAEAFRVWEPFQRGSGAEPLTVAAHVEDLHELIQARCGGVRPALVGHSWGAMLALAYAAAHPEGAAALVLIGCGTFDDASRKVLEETRRQRMDEALGRRMERLSLDYPDPDERLAALGRMFEQIDSVELIAGGGESLRCDAQAGEETWNDMLRLQAEGVYPGAFAAIGVPALMLHGREDPHPGAMIYAGLKVHLPQLEYHELARCGHYPWREKAARDEFYAMLRGWLERKIARGK
jgi:pimeloyl-ACP methyl ester carboxylesterase